MPGISITPRRSPRPSGPAPSPLVAIHALLPCTLLALATATHAGAPLQTEDAGALDAGQCEIEAAAERARSGDARARAGSAGLACGLADGLQLGIALARGRGDGERADGATLGFKWRLAGRADGDWQLTLAASAARARAQGEGWRRSGEAATLVLSHAAGPGQLHAALTHEREAATRTATTAWGLAWEAEPMPAAGLGWAPMAEWLGDDRGGRGWGLGLRATILPEQLWLDVGLGRAWHADDATARERRARIGLKWAF